MACSAGAWGMGLHAAPISSVQALHSCDRFSRWKNLVCLQLKIFKKKSGLFCAVYALDPVFAYMLVLSQLLEF